MKNINLFIKDNIGAVSTKVSVAPKIPNKKLNNAVKAFNCEDNLNSILAIYDNTSFGSAKEGLVFTGEKIIYKPSSSEPTELHFNDFESVEYIENVTVSEKGKEKREEYIEIALSSGKTVTLKDLLSCNYKKLADILKEAFSDFDEFEEENQIVTLAEMSEELKIAYVKVIINMTFADDGKVDEKELAEILSLMTRLDLSTDSRFKLREYTISEAEQELLEQLLDTIDKEAGSHNKSIKISLVKDLISTFISANEGSYKDFSYKDFEFLTANQSLFGVSDEEIEFVVKTIMFDFGMLDKDFTDAAFIKGIKELTANAGAVGVPLAAVYLSGSVIGMSAAGMTSGLAALGLGGVLGFSSMATGIGVAVLLGVGAYKGVRHFTGANELDKTKRRVLMLNEMIKQIQATISLLVGDINYITIKLNEAFYIFSLQDAQIKNLESSRITQDEHINKLELSRRTESAKTKKLMYMMSQLTGAGEVLNKKYDTIQNRELRANCPEVLDESKLKSLTSEPVKKQYYTIVLKYYEEQIVQEETKNGETQNVKQLRRKQGIPTKELEKLASIFEVIGYFKAADVLKGAASDMTDKAKRKITGFFSK
ncbi:hypothetical protein [Candidatus Parabeggiatoa sp. HSG14]|uniref:hypothetical protein n=1 Tax=Candidatus Parabeggiatoa sp. HSG14 TaxID=3055593 RepID=UPI0025A6DD96|nr:hypothetical protein [Thiotrichales bacterium HSG14]